jgi:16S rRNA G966 N2-methylase RsmD
LCVVRGFAEAVYPGLELVDEVRRSDDRPSHAVIIGENYHALALMHFMWEGKVDCIYIDPPYNSARPTARGTGIADPWRQYVANRSGECFRTSVVGGMGS